MKLCLVGKKMEGEKKKIFKGTKALKPRLFSFFGYLKIQEISSNVLCSSILLLLNGGHEVFVLCSLSLRRG